MLFGLVNVYGVDCVLIVLVDCSFVVLLLGWFRVVGFVLLNLLVCYLRSGSVWWWFVVFWFRFGVVFSAACFACLFW